jgi:hypothetical protein
MTKSKLEIVGTLPAGTYYIGDPCYVIEDHWDAFLEALNAAEGKDGYLRGVVFTFAGRQVFVSATNTGDGVYRDNEGVNYPVDAGMLAAIPVELTGTRGHVFTQAFEVGTDVGRWRQGKNGQLIGKRIKIGSIIIKT